LNISQKYNILGIIPARAGSKRIPGKNKKILAGKELVRYAIETAIDSTLITDLVVNSDDKEILKIASEYNKVISLERPQSISGDLTPAITYVNHSLDELKKQFDYVVIIQVSSPLTITEDIDNTLKLLIQSGADSAVSIMKLDHAIHPIKLKTLDGNKLNPFLEEENGRMATHELPELYVRNCAIYASAIATINSGKVIGDDCRGYLMPRERSLDINDPIDWEFAEFLMNKK
jgi:CMP-N-acetylneuraminic acid synthetase